jgi:hypothetical protein
MCNKEDAAAASSSLRSNAGEAPASRSWQEASLVLTLNERKEC